MKLFQPFNRSPEHLILRMHNCMKKFIEKRYRKLTSNNYTFSQRFLDLLKLGINGTKLICFCISQAKVLTSDLFGHVS